MKLRFLFILAITQFMAVSAQLKEFSLDNPEAKLTLDSCRKI